MGCHRGKDNGNDWVTLKMGMEAVGKMRGMGVQLAIALGMGKG